MEISLLGSNHSLPVFQQDYFKCQPNLKHQGSYLSRLYHRKSQEGNLMSITFSPEQEQLI